MHDKSLNQTPGGRKSLRRKSLAASPQSVATSLNITPPSAKKNRKSLNIGETKVANAASPGGPKVNGNSAKKTPAQPKQNIFSNASGKKNRKSNAAANNLSIASVINDDSLSIPKTPASNKKNKKLLKVLDTKNSNSPLLRKLNNEENPTSETPQQPAQSIQPISSKKKKKRQSSSNDSEVAASPPKKPKFPMFKGTSALNVGVTENKAANKNATKQSASNSATEQERIEKRALKMKKTLARRKAKRKNLKEAELALQSGGEVSQDFLTRIPTVISELEARPELTKTARKKLEFFKKLQALASGKGDTIKQEGGIQNKKQQSKPQQTPALVKPNQKQKLQKTPKQVPIPIKEQEVVDEDASSDSDDEEADSTLDEEETDGALAEADSDEEAQGEEDSDEEQSEDASGEEDVDAQGSEDEEEEEEDDIEDSEEDEDEKKKNSAPPVKEKRQKDTNQQKPFNAAEKPGGKSRYVLFVGNLPYTAGRDEIKEHFKKVGEIQDIRIPLDKTSRKPRGFAYVEVLTDDAYQRALSLHHTFVEGRRINVMYTAGGKKKGPDVKKEIKQKNLKLHGMMKQGLLAGSVKEDQKRSARRAKKRKAEQSGPGDE